jgi:hypothetical protein
MVNFYHPMQIMKSSPTERGDRVEVLLRASSEKEDSQGETILKTAYADHRMRSDFANKGYYDYNHATDIIESLMLKANGKELNDLMLQRERGTIGYPSKEFAIGLKDEFPNHLFPKGSNPPDGIYSHGYLFSGNDFVKEMIPKMRSGFPYGASVSGTCSKSDMVGNKITRLNLKKIAIAPLNDVINDDTTVFLKSKMVLLRNIRKSMEFPDNQGLDYDLGMHDERLEEARFQKIEKKLAFMEKIIMANPEFQDQYLEMILKDIKGKIDSQEMELGYSPVKQALMDVWCMDAETSDYMANQVLINYEG